MDNRLYKRLIDINILMQNNLALRKIIQMNMEVLG